MKHLESIQQAQVVEWSRWAYKANPARYKRIMMINRTKQKWNLLWYA